MSLTNNKEGYYVTFEDTYTDDSFLEVKAYSAGFAINMQSVYSNSMSRAAESTNVKNVSGFFGNGATITELMTMRLLDLMYILPVIGFYNAKGIRNR